VSVTATVLQRDLTLRFAGNENVTMNSLPSLRRLAPALPKRSWIFAAFLLVVAGGTFRASALAQSGPVSAETSPGPEVADLPVQIITASGVHEPVSQVAQSLQFYPQEELRLQRSRSLVDFFSEKSIGFAAPFAPGHAWLSMRGAITNQIGFDDASEITVLINSRRAGTVNLSKLSPIDAYRIEVLRGPSSIIYGSSAIGGVINLITKNGLNSPGTRLIGTAGSWDRYTAGFEAGGKRGRFDYYVGVQYETSGDFKTGHNSPGDGVLLNTGYTRRTANLTLGYDLLRGVRGQLVLRTDGLFDVGHRGLTHSLTDHDDRYNQSVELMVDGAVLQGRAHWYSQTFYVRDVEKWFWSQNPLLFPFSSPALGDRPGIQRDDNTRKNNVWGQNSRITIDLSRRNTLLAGLDLEATRLRNNRVREGAPGYVEGWRPNPVGQPTVRTSPVNIAPVHLNYDSEALGIYVEDTQRLLESRLTVKAGARFDLRSQRLRHTVYESPGTNTKTTDSDAVTYRLGASYAARPWLTLRANVGTGFRAPSPNELNGDGFVGNGVRIIGNPNLENETALGWEVGAAAAPGPLSADLTYFSSDVKNRITVFANAAATAASGFTSSINSNLAHARTEGLEFRLACQVSRWLGLPDYRFEPFVSGHYNLKFEVDDPVYRALNNDQHILRVSKYQASAGLRLGHREKWEATLVALLNGPTYEPGQGQALINANYPANPATGQPLLTWVFKRRPFWVLNARISGQISERLRVFGGVNNLLNLNYDPSFLALNEVNGRYTVNPYKSQSRSTTGASSPGRELFAGLEVSF
jgi:vitamin B12 transporter